MIGFKIEKFNVGKEQRSFILSYLPQLQKKKILIIGDVGLDEYVMGEVRRISPEAPVPVLEVENEDMRLGLAANVAQNVVSLGGEAHLVSVVGEDAGAQLLKDLYQKSHISWQHTIVDSSRPTTRKMRVMAQHHHIVRVDYEQKKYLSAEVENKLINKIAELASACDGIILQDYAKGVISSSLVKRVVEIARQHKKPLMADPHRSNPAEYYAGVDLIKPNYDESIALSGLKFDELKTDPDKVYKIGRAIQKKTGANNVVLTRGKEGMTIFSGEKISEVPTFARKVFDVTGAGDTVIAALSLGWVSGLSLEQSCMLANFAAGVVVGKIGCVPCEIPELKEYIQEVR